jgi:DNA-binding response OmpR family regulator
MTRDRSPERRELVSSDKWDFYGDADGLGAEGDEVFIRPPASYRQAYGDEPIRVGIVEFRVMLLLASRPYHAFTRRQIAEAAGSEGQPLTEDSVDAYVASLREQLGVLHDFVQTVPYVGYRFKA